MCWLTKKYWGGGGKDSHWIDTFYLLPPGALWGGGGIKLLEPLYLPLGLREGYCNDMKAKKISLFKSLSLKVSPFQSLALPKSLSSKVSLFQSLSLPKSLSSKVFSPKSAFFKVSLFGHRPPSPPMLPYGQNERPYMKR
jgi:hypothetical protein